ncbi:MAG: hypothetical protein FK730_02075 [Asgard group archaeon]|nr:hypothetical protein [Asgard group archaeon]
MLKNKTVKKTLMFTFMFLIVMSSVSVVEHKAAVVPNLTYEPRDTDYATGFYAEGVEIVPFRNTAAGVHSGFIGGSVTLPFDLTEVKYNSLQAFSLVLSNQQLWRNHNLPRRFWDIADGATLMLVFTGDPNLAIDLGREIKDMIEYLYNLNMFLVYGHYESDNGRQMTMLVYQGRVDITPFNDFVENFTTYVADDGLGMGITEEVLNDAPVKAMSVSLYRGAVFREIIPVDLIRLFPFIAITPLFIPIIECAWVDPDGLQKTDTVIEMNLTRLMPDLSVVEGASNSRASFVGMKLPYVVDVLEIDPPTDNMYSHLKGEFEWALKLDLPFIGFSRSHDDIYVKYDLNITALTHYPQVIGEMSINPASSLMGGGDLICDFTFENVGDEPAYDLTIQYGEFNENQTAGMELPVTNPDLTFFPNQIMYYDNDTEIFSDVDSLGPNIITLEGWFYNNSGTGDWLANNQIMTDEEMVNILENIYVNETFLNLNPMDFTLSELTEDTDTLNTTIAQLNPGEKVTLSFAIENIPTGTADIYSGLQENETAFQIYVSGTVDWQEAIIALLQLAGSSLHIPEDQVTWTNWFPQPVFGSAYMYTDLDGKEYLGITNGLVIQAYDDEAILVGKMSIDKDPDPNNYDTVYRFGEDVQFNLTLTNIGDAPAQNIHYAFYHAFLTEDFNIPKIEEIPGTGGMIPLINPGETETVLYTYPAETAVGLHPVFSIFNYTSVETVDALHPDIFSTVGHPAVFSSMDFGVVLPPISKEGTTRPVYPTPEVNTTTEILGYVPNETTVGDTITLRTTIKNNGDEDTNIIYTQFIPRRLIYVEHSLEITVDGEPITDFELDYRPYQPDITQPRYNPFMPAVRIYGDSLEGYNVGIPLKVGEELVIQADFTIARRRGIEEVDWNTLSGGDLVGLYIPPADIRYFSHFEMQETRELNDNTDVPRESEEATATSLASTVNGIYTLTLNEKSTIIEERASTNSWGSYSDSLSLVIQELFGLGPNAIYYGLGIIVVTGVAVLIYFTANGKRRK